MPTPRQPLSLPTSHRAPRRRILACGVPWLMLLAGAISGCGESNSTPAASVAAPANTASTPTATTGTASKPQSTTAPSAKATHSGRSALAKARAHAAFSSLAHAKPEHKLTAAQRARIPVADIELSSPAIPSGGVITRENTCDGSNQSPALRWRNVPPGTAEIVVFAISATPVDGKLFFDWALAGLDPKLGGIPAGQLPQGAIPGRNGYGHNGYSICPEPGKQETYVFAVYALPERLATNPGFDPASLRAQAKQTAQHTGLLVGSYQRK